MANWITLRQAAEKYETTIKDILSWSELPEITFTYINHTLLLNDDSVCYFIESHSPSCRTRKGVWLRCYL